jgi:hypothetical protein
MTKGSEQLKRREFIALLGGTAYLATRRVVQRRRRRVAAVADRLSLKHVWSDRIR